MTPSTWRPAEPSPARACWLGLAATLLGVLSGPLPGARAQPVVVVRAEARIELRARHEDDAIVVEGSLVDDLGEPLAGRTVVVGIHEPGGRTLVSERRRTDGRGTFQLGAPGTAATYLLSARYAGDEHHPRLAVERVADLRRTPVTLRLRVGGDDIDGALDLDQPMHPITVEARSDRGGARLPVTLRDELGRELGSGTTDAEGRWRTEIASERLGPPGAGRLVAGTEGDEARADARVETPIVRFRRPTLTLEASETALDAERTLELTGVLRTSAGPEHDEAIGLYVEGEHLRTTVTDGEGRYAATVEAADLPDGAVAIVARFESDGPGVPGAEAGPALVVVRGGLGAEWGWLALPLGLAILALVWLRRRAPVGDATEPPPPAPIGVVVEGSPRRGAARTRIAGRILDGRGRPLRGEARATDGGEPSVARCDAQGRFELELRAGRWTVDLDAPRHAPVRIEAEIPHRGELEGLVVRLESWRARALAALRDRFTRRGGSLDHWRKTTVHALRADPELGPTAADVEVTYYGPAEPEPERVERLRRPEGEAAEPPRRGPAPGATGRPPEPPTP